jgi:hypothetical protein
VLVVERVSQEEELALLGGEQEYEAHHHREGGLVQPLLVGAREQGPAPVLVLPVYGLYEDLDGLADLVAELVGDLLLILRALLE